MLKVEVPATSANCSIGFDSLGLALNWKARFTFEPADRLIITGCPKEYANEDNLVIQAFAYTAAACGKEMPDFHMHSESQIPFARGLGSSSCCVAAGIVAANAWLDLHLSDERLLELAVDLEGHPDNAAPALFGGMTACLMQKKTADAAAAGKDENPSASLDRSASRKITTVKFDCADFHCLAIIPPYEVSTPEARKVLPKMLPYQEAVEQTGHALIFEYAIQKGDEALLAEACSDHLHEPYRKVLIPDYEAVKAAADALHLPFWISGSGPTMLALSLDEEKLRKMESWLHEALPSLQTRMLKIAKEGTTAVYE